MGALEGFLSRSNRLPLSLAQRKWRKKHRSQKEKTPRVAGAPRPVLSLSKEGGEGEGPVFSAAAESRWKRRSLGGVSSETQGRVEGHWRARRFGSTFFAGKRWRELPACRLPAGKAGTCMHEQRKYQRGLRAISGHDATTLAQARSARHQILDPPDKRGCIVHWDLKHLDDRSVSDRSQRDSRH